LELLRQAEESDQAFCKGGAMAYRAMTLQRMGRGAEAAEVLHAAAQLIAEPLRRRSAGLSLERSAGLWWDLDICEMALDEARQLISQARNL
jgi:hypothetical protein